MGHGAFLLPAHLQLWNTRTDILTRLPDAGGQAPQRSHMAHGTWLWLHDMASNERERSIIDNSADERYSFVSDLR